MEKRKKLILKVWKNVLWTDKAKFECFADKRRESILKGNKAEN